MVTNVLAWKYSEDAAAWMQQRKQVQHCLFDHWLALLLGHASQVGPGVLLLQRCGGAPRLHCGQNPGAAVHGGQAWPGLNRRYDSVSEQHALSLTSRLETYYESSNVSTRVTGDALGVCIRYILFLLGP